MIFFLLAALLILGVFYITLFVRPQDLPTEEPVSPTAHLEGRRAAIYEGLRDLQFEYRLGKLSEEDYQRTKQDLQKQLAAVLAEMDRIGGQNRPAPAAAVAAGSGKRGRKQATQTCPHCGARFEKAMRFCGECGKPMAEQTA